MPVTLIREGVLIGSRGALMYPKDIICESTQNWQGIPLTVNHPDIDGEAVSAKRPDVVEKFGIGFLRAPICRNGTLKAQAVIDVNKCRALDPRILRSLERGEKVEVSTGVGTRTDKTGGTFNGKKFHSIVSHLTPDHLAILPDQRGACSRKDGCGIGLDPFQPLEINSMSTSITNAIDPRATLDCEEPDWQEIASSNGLHVPPPVANRQTRTVPTMPGSGDPLPAVEDIDWAELSRSTLRR